MLLVIHIAHYYVINVLFYTVACGKYKLEPEVEECNKREREKKDTFSSFTRSSSN